MTSVTAPPAGSSPFSGNDRSHSRFGDQIFAGLSRGAGIAVVALVTGIGVFLVMQAAPALAKNEANFLTARVFDVDGGTLRFGVADLLWVTIISSLVAMALAVPVAVGVALFITHYAPRRLAAPAAYLIDLLAAVPSIVYGLWGAKVFLDSFRGSVQEPMMGALGGIGLFRDVGVTAGTIALVSVVLSIMILPIITAITREVFAQTPVAHQEAALALGATKWETIRTTVLPFGRPGLISAAMLGLGRALGETIAVTIILSTLPSGKEWSFSLFNGGETFASRIANNAAEFDSPTKTGAFIAAGLVLFILTFVVNAIARIVIERNKAFRE
ncbi:MAG: phosphate ABC transporter permease subunit PstC [Actinomycetota bacterium]